MNKKILVIDDEPDFCYVVKKNLEAFGGFDVSICTDATESVKLAEKLLPDIILLDIIMPKLSGTQIAAQLKENKATKDIPVAYLTGIVTDFDTVKNGETGKGGFFIAKPIKMKDLVDVINNLTI